MVPAFDKVRVLRADRPDQPADQVAVRLSHHPSRSRARRDRRRRSRARRRRSSSTLRQQQEAPLIQPFLQGLQQKATIVVNDPQFAGLFATPPRRRRRAAQLPAATTVSRQRRSSPTTAAANQEGVLVRIAGLGPGDPGLLTIGSLDALRAIGRAVVLLAPPDLDGLSRAQRRRNRARNGRRSGAARAGKRRRDRAFRAAHRRRAAGRMRWASAFSAIRSPIFRACRHCCARSKARHCLRDRSGRSARDALGLDCDAARSAAAAIGALLLGRPGRDHGAPAHGVPVGSRADASHARPVSDRGDVRGRRGDRALAARRALRGARRPAASSALPRPARDRGGKVQHRRRRRRALEQDGAAPSARLRRRGDRRRRRAVAQLGAAQSARKDRTRAPQPARRNSQASRRAAARPAHAGKGGARRLRLARRFRRSRQTLRRAARAGRGAPASDKTIRACAKSSATSSSRSSTFRARSASMPKPRCARPTRSFTGALPSWKNAPPQEERVSPIFRSTNSRNYGNWRRLKRASCACA